MKEIIRNVERYHFTDDQKKDYCAQIYSLIAEGHIIYRKLFQEEMDSGNNFFANINQNWNPMTNKDAAPPSNKKEEAFTLVRGRKKGRSPTPPKESSTKKAKTFELDTTNRFSTLNPPQNTHDNSNEDVNSRTNEPEGTSQANRDTHGSSTTTSNNHR
ncbi:hypothetical protein TNCT_486071 [Trichonephila clavata]|uniref:Uncharacterized protein n=1 Tax=Trichonephila clavata TaxID=2740835 RepID=A0A8X6GS21_TRICU|nr:hypothetical protein TNCT_486071 [Trichonephila clavata]